MFSSLSQKFTEESRPRLIEQGPWTGMGFASPMVRRDLHDVGEALADLKD